MLAEDVARKRDTQSLAVRPASATHALVALAGLLTFLGVLTVLRFAGMAPDSAPDAAFFTTILTGAAIFGTDMVLTRVHLRASTGLNYKADNPSLTRVGCKLVGVGATVAGLAAVYWLAPEYRGTFYEPYFAAIRTYLSYAVVLTPVYFHYVDRYMVEPRDGYWHVGAAVLGRFQEVQPGIVVQHVLGWLVKGFFLPLMFVYFCRDIEWLLSFDFSGLTSFALWHNFIYEMAFMVDVGLATVGYLLAVRIFDTHIRSAEPTLFGWLVAVMCYEPFSSLIMRQYFGYTSPLRWGAWLENHPVLSVLWGCAILLLIGIYVWATIMFGARFSNLTHRGIITNGPYRWTRHPAYVAKNLSWWMIYIPFVPQVSTAETVRHCLLLLGVNTIYFLRAKTEEWHLSTDPDYRAYSQFIRERGLFRFLPRMAARLGRA